MCECRQNTKSCANAMGITCASTRALSISVLESAIKPLMAHPVKREELH